MEEKIERWGKILKKVLIVISVINIPLSFLVIGFLSWQNPEVPFELWALLWVAWMLIIGLLWFHYLAHTFVGRLVDIAIDNFCKLPLNLKIYFGLLFIIGITAILLIAVYR